MNKKIDINDMTTHILKKNTLTVLKLTQMTLHVRPGLPEFKFLLKRGEHYINFKGTELILQSSFNGYRVVLLDTQHYGCAVHIVTFSVSEMEIRQLQTTLGGEIEDCMVDRGELIESIIMPEKKRLLWGDF